MIGLKSVRPLVIGLKSATLNRIGNPFSAVVVDHFLPPPVSIILFLVVVLVVLLV